MSIQATLGDPNWVVANFLKVRNIFPPSRTLIGQQQLLRIGFAMKVAGIEWKTEAELGQAMVLCYHLGMYSQSQAGDCVFVERSSAKMPPVKFFNLSPAQVEVNRLLRQQPPANVQQLAAEALQRVMYSQRHGK